MQARGRQSRQNRRLLKRTGIVLVSLLIVAAGYLGYRVWDTMAQIHSRSTPPPALDAEVLGGTPGTMIDSGPAMTAVATYSSNGAGRSEPISNATAYREMVSGIQTNNTESFTSGNASWLSQEGIAPPALVDVPDTVQVFLFMGVDARPGEPIDVGVRPDSLSVAAYDTATNSCRLLSIQRDSRVELPGYGLSKINHALAMGGIEYQKLVVEQFLGIPIDHYALIDFTGVAAVVDKIGGVDVVISDDPFTIGEYTFKPGPAHLSGSEALAYSRYRNGPDGDFGRIRRQHQIIGAALTKLSSSSAPSMAQLVPTTMDDLAAHFRTDLGVSDLTSLATDVIQHCSASRSADETIQGSASWFTDPIMNMELWYLTVDPEDRDRKVRWLVTGTLPGDGTPTAPSTPEAVLTPTYARRDDASRG